MKILLLGGSGQLGKEIIRSHSLLNLNTGLENNSKTLTNIKTIILIAPTSKELNITNKDSVQKFIEKLEPDLVINCAAYTAVDDAETKSEIAFSVNAEAVKYISLACSKVHSRLIQISTDYVFGGMDCISINRTPLLESDPTSPVNIYGESKLKGENYALDILQNRCLVLRTSSVYGEFGKNFVYTMINLFKTKNKVSIVSDQFMSPTWTGWLADSILKLVNKECHGILNASSKGEISWYDFGLKIFEYTKEKFIFNENLIIEKTTSEKFISTAKRPSYSCLNCEKLTSILENKVLWSDSLQSFVNTI